MKLNKTISYFKTSFNNLCRSKNSNPEQARREIILNNLLCFSIISFLLINIIRIKDIIVNPADRGIPLLFTTFIVLLLVFLFFLSKKGKIKIASSLFIAIFATPMLYCFIYWGADLPAALILSILIIALSGVLINARASIFSAILINAFLITLTYLQEKNLITVKSYWRLENHEIADAIVYASLIMIITIIVLIFDKHLRKALKIAQEKERALEIEKESLEVKVKERTKAIREMEAEKIGQLYRLAEFGRISAGIFHDLINPLTAISLNLEQINYQENEKLKSTKDCLEQAIIASHRMEDLISSIKKSINTRPEKKKFFLISEIKNTASLLAYQARKENIIIDILGDKNIYLFGDALKFSQIITNLIANSIEACITTPKDKEKKIIIKLKKINSMSVLKIIDNGEGIAPENIGRIFEPFFTTKLNKGMGLGLSSTKNLIEKDFKGSIKAYTSQKNETVFIIKIPLT
jgi:signal transduction histidine kinase